MLDDMMKALEERAKGGDAKAQFALAKNWDDAWTAAKNWLPFTSMFKLKRPAGAKVGRDTCQVLGIGVHLIATEALEIMGYQKTYHTGNISQTSFTLAMSYDDALSLADAINDQLAEHRRLREFEDMRDNYEPKAEG